jgi:hypothetical protein
MSIARCAQITRRLILDATVRAELKRVATWLVVNACRHQQLAEHAMRSGSLCHQSPLSNCLDVE